MQLRAVVLVLVLVLAGCQARVTVRAAAAEGPEVVRTWANQFLWGYVGAEVQTNLSLVTRVETFRTWWQWIACAATGGLWLPTSVEVFGWYGYPGGGGVVQNVNVTTPVVVNTGSGEAAASTSSSAGGQ